MLDLVETCRILFLETSDVMELRLRPVLIHTWTADGAQLNRHFNCTYSAIVVISNEAA